MTLQGKRVLVVEDEVLLAMMLEDVFSDAGAHVVGPAATVEQAIALCAGYRLHQPRGCGVGKRTDAVEAVPV